MLRRSCWNQVLAVVTWVVFTLPTPESAFAREVGVLPEPVLQSLTETLARPVFQKSFNLGPIFAPSPTNAPVYEKGRLQIGVRRNFDEPAIVSRHNAGTGDWTQMPDGSRLWAARISAEGAKGLRLHLQDVRLPPGATFLVYSPAHRGPGGTCTATDLVGVEDVWMPSVLAETLVFECRVPPEVDLKDVSFTIDGVSHLYDSPAPSLAKIGGCHADVSCFDSWHNVAGGVGRITFVEDGNTFICSGGLLQDNTASGPYFLTANHCIGNQSVASTLEVFWLYQTSECQGPSPTLSEVPRTPGGADYVAGSRGNDFALLRLRRVPPPGVVYLSWSAQPPATGEAVATIHHPGGSYKRISLGAKTGADSAFTKVRWSTGVTEPGSSGAPLFNSRQEVVGQLYGGSSSCGNPDGVDSFGKFEITYQTVKTWLHSAEPAPAPPLPIPRGTYMGLFHKADGLSIETSGTLAITTAANRRFTGAIRMSSGSHAFSGVFDASGQASITISRGAWPALRTFLQVDNSDRDRLTGEIAGSGWSSILTANRAVYNGTTQIAPQASRYTLAIPGAGPGDGFAIGSITKAGRTFITGKLPGGPTWSRSGFISKEGEFPLLALMSGGREMLAGWISFGEGYWSSPGGALTWVPQDGSILSLGMSGSRYVAPAPLQPVLEASALSITFSSDGASSTFRIPLGPKRKILVTNDDLSRVSITFNGNGTFSGKVLGGVTDQTASFTGVLLQNVQMGFGAFSGSGSLGTVRLVPE